MRRAVFDHAHVDRLRAVVVGDARVDEVERDALEGQFAAPASQAQREHHAGRVFGQQCIDALARARKRHRQDRPDHRMRADVRVRERTHHLLRGIVGIGAEGFEAGEQDRSGHAHQNTSHHMSRKFTTSSASAVGHCARITPYWSGSSSSTAGTMLKLAAIGVSSVPQ